MKTTIHVLVDCAGCGMKMNRNSAFATLDRFGKRLYFCSDRCSNNFLIGKEKTDFRGDVQNIPIDCPKCKGKQGVRRNDSLVIRCFVCGTPVSKMEVLK
jgi:YHS domain-containing protein